MRNLVSSFCQGNRRFYFKLILITFLIFLMLFNSLTSFTVTSASEEPKCIEDKLISKTNILYNFLNFNSELKKVVSAMTFWIFDISILVTSINWVWKGKNSRPILNLLLFFSLWTVCNWGFRIKEHKEILWNDTNVFSIFVSHSKSNNSFFSAIIGVYAICALELYENNFKKFSFLTMFGMISYFVLSLALRFEYFISLFCGITAAHYFHILANKYHNTLDNLYNLSLHKPVNQSREMKTILSKSKKDDSELYQGV
jgi:hypothetical protein